MDISIQNQIIDMDKVARLYPAAMISTGEKDELTQISLEWVDTLKSDDIAVEQYAIFVHLKDSSVSSFFYQDRADLEKALDDIAHQLV